MTPSTGERVLRFVGDRLRFSLRTFDGQSLPSGWRVLLRTNLGRGRVLRHEIIHSYPAKPPLAGAAWHDLPLLLEAGAWSREVTLTETGYFRAKAYAVDAQGRQHWPDGPDVGISIHPDAYRTGNTIYCAFVRMFGASKSARSTANPAWEAQLKSLDQRGYTVIPPSGKLRDLVREFPHIFDTLGCRILHLLPVTPTPAVLARFGRFGSPYAVQDLTAIDPALVEFDKRTTGLDQFRELTDAAHQHGGRVFLDIVINHTGWGARLQEEHPDWYVRNERGEFASPGAWGVTWEDLVELNHQHPELWENLAEVFLTWCRRGVDGFRCDAGYKIPVAVWRYITARVLDEFPETVFLLEGLGGSWEATEALLTDGAMQWAYSELFQNYSGPQVAAYLDYATRQSERVGLYIHYSETHDNNRLAQEGRAWSLLRNRLCALASVSGGYGFTCGVEWLAAEKVNVHSARGLSWGARDNILPELARLNELLATHPCFFDGARLTRLSTADSPVLALRREAAESGDCVLVLVNNDAENEQDVVMELAALKSSVLPASGKDLLGQSPPAWQPCGTGQVGFRLPPGAAYCLEMGRSSADFWDDYPRRRAQASWAVQMLATILPPENIGAFDWRRLAQIVEQSPRRFLAALGALDRSLAATNLIAALDQALASDSYPAVTLWRMPDQRRITPLPQDHWLLIEDAAAFRATLACDSTVRHVQSIVAGGRHIAALPPTPFAGTASLRVDRYHAERPVVRATLRYLSPAPAVQECLEPFAIARRATYSNHVALLTNGRGGMARICVDLGQVASKYDCLLGANLHPSVPVDRHVLAKRLRAWIVADGFITPLNADNLLCFTAGPPAVWQFLANAGDGRAVEVELTAEMREGQNSLMLRWHRASTPPPIGRELPADSLVGLTVRVDIEDRNFHAETHRNGAADHHFSANCRALPQHAGFEFTPDSGRRLRAVCDRGVYHHEAEWCERMAHPLEATRGLVAEGDAYSPGWFEIPLGPGEDATLVITAERGEMGAGSTFNVQRSTVGAARESGDSFRRRLERAVRAFVVRRGEGKTVIAGYPWFLDWGRDTLIAARGLLAGGLREDVREVLRTFGRFEARGTLPNSIHGENASNRDTTDAALWYGLVCEELASGAPQPGAPLPPVYETTVDAQGRTIGHVLRSIAANYVLGTPNGIRMDPESGLVWSPGHFTWMDTNYPAGTPREGYPVEIQVLWIRLLRQLARLGAPAGGESWAELAGRAEKSFHELFWLEEQGWLADCLLAARGQPARAATPDSALRSNGLFAVSLGLTHGERARRVVDVALQHLIVPGALRSLAPLPVSPPLPIHGADGRLLNDPTEPYCGRYEGDEDTQRKPAYHNGTAWTWTLPTFCEALVRAWDEQPAAVIAAKAYLGSMARLMEEGCLGHIPEILDGDAPHTARGCDAQAWGATEALRVWKWLESKT